jgi:hypothetical protein
MCLYVTNFGTRISFQKSTNSLRSVAASVVLMMIFLAHNGQEMVPAAEIEPSAP